MKLIHILLSLWSTNLLQTDAHKRSSPLSYHRIPSRDVSLIRFLLFTTKNPIEHQELKFNDSHSVAASFFDAKRPTKIIVHGYDDQPLTTWIIKMKNEYLKKSECNVISIDWSKLSGPSPFYFVAAKNVHAVGDHVAEFLLFLRQFFGLRMENYDSFHVVGFSLGGQVVGRIGNRLGESGVVAARITGLDPAGLLFHHASPAEKLTSNSARFVDVVHAAGLWIGMDETVGHVDFFPNGGKAPQPGCRHHEGLGLLCSHLRAPAYFTESINSKNAFASLQCDSWGHFRAGECNNTLHRNRMGEFANPGERGKFYLMTNSKPPYRRRPQSRYYKKFFHF